MKLLPFFTLLLVAFAASLVQAKTLYEHYTQGGVHSGLVANTSEHFVLNGKPYIIYGGSFHYFRVVPQAWRSTLLKYKAAGLNSVQLYLPWNLHEEIPGHFDFESDRLNFEKVLQIIKELDMFAVVRPGPYICAEWDNGGLPSWLLRDPNMRVRFNYPPFLDHTRTYYNKVLAIVNRHQFSVNGGPVIAMQIENEYFTSGMEISVEYLKFLQKLVLDSGFKQLIFTSDPGTTGSQAPIRTRLENVLETINLNSDVDKLLPALHKNQPDKPVYISEFWPGWFDAWNEHGHHTYSVQKFEDQVSKTLFKYQGSVNFYMFIGGTNFAFTNGGLDVTSYDYDAPLSEAANYTAKYWKTLELYKQGVAKGIFPADVTIPKVPEAPKALAYGKVAVKEMLPYEKLLDKATQTHIDYPVSMELLPIGKDYGQRFGYVVYRIKVDEAVRALNVTGRVKDSAIVIANGVNRAEFGSDHQTYESKNVTQTSHSVVDVFVENRGRANGGNDMNHNNRKGLQSNITINGHVHRGYTAFSLDFPDKYVHELEASHDWTSIPSDVHSHYAPSAFRTTLNIDGPGPEDTYLALHGWNKGHVHVNGFNLGRYWHNGPQQTLYVPAPVLKKGHNSIVIFEMYQPGKEIEFLDHPILGENDF